MTTDSAVANPSPLPIDELRKVIANASPLALPGLLRQAEFYDRTEAITVLESVCREFEEPAKCREHLGLNVVTGFVDQTIRQWDLGRTLGISSQRLVEEIRVFSYDKGTESVSVRGHQNLHGDTTQQAYSKERRVKIEDRKAMTNAKKETFALGKQAENEYGGRAKLRETNAEVKADRRIVAKNRTKHIAEADHVISLKTLDARLQAFGYLTEAQAKEVANMRDNLAVTDAHTNRSKRDRDAKELAEVSKFKDKREALLAKNRTAEIQTNLETARLAGGNVAASNVGDIIAVAVVPLGFEILDITENGLQSGSIHGTNAFECISCRLKRVFSYILNRLPGMLTDLAKDLFAMLQKLLVTILGGIIKKGVKIVVDGLNIIVEALKILFTPSKTMTAQHRAEAFVKLLGGFLVGYVVDVAVSSLLPPGLGILGGFVGVVAGTLASALFLYILDSLDLFSAKAERRLARIEEVFSMRIQEVRESTASFHLAASQRLREQRLRFETLRNRLGEAIEVSDYETINEVVDGVANFLDVRIPYANSEEFMAMLRRDDKIMIGTSPG